jgi:uncharacterized protein (DUF427 family)
MHRLQLTLEFGIRLRACVFEWSVVVPSTATRAQHGLAAYRRCMTFPRKRPVTPRPGQESVWDYPRPPRVEHTTEHVVLELGGRVIAETNDAVRVLETSHSPVYYLPGESFVPDALQPADGTTFCEYKGVAHYLSVGSEDGAGWFYPSPSAGFEELVGRVAVYPARMERCIVDDEVVRAQAGDFYGGWITEKIVGPFKGEPGTQGW